MTQLYVNVTFEHMAKVCKLKWNMRAVKAQISMRGNRFYKVSHSPIMMIWA